MRTSAPIPVALSDEGVPAMRISDFVGHLSWVVNDLIRGDEYTRILVTANGSPDFLCLPIRSDPADWTRQRFDVALDPGRPHPKRTAMGAFVRITDFRDHRPDLLAGFLPDVGEFHVTRRGWPAFIVRQASLDGIDMNQRIVYENVASWPTPEPEQEGDDDDD